jgi:nicotinate-nucleotide--dimethylbenzimidazole phosphoribosyltransferase
LTTLPAVASLADVRRVLAALPGPHTDAAAEAAAREPQLTKPPGSLGRLEELAAWLAAWQGRHPPRVDKPWALVFAGNHGVVGRGVSAFPAEVTAQMVANFEAGGAAVNQLCRASGVELEVQALGLETPTRDFTEGPAMDDAECAAAFDQGMAAVPDGADLVCPGEMGIGNTTAAAAISHALHGGTAEDWTGPGTGVAGDALANKIAVVAEAVRLHADAATDGIEALCRLGGREIAAMAGAIARARVAGIPVILDGFICCAAAACLAETAPRALDHCVAGHVSAEAGHAALLDRLGKAPLLSLGMRLGEGSGAALAIHVLKGAVACHSGMATFAEAGVSEG